MPGPPLGDARWEMPARAARWELPARAHSTFESDLDSRGRNPRRGRCYETFLGRFGRGPEPVPASSEVFMSSRTARRLAPGALAILAAAIALALFTLHGNAARAAERSVPAGNILIAWGVGGVLTDDGTLW